MKLHQTPLAGLYIAEPRVFEDSRGHFFESYSTKYFEDAGINCTFVQDNQSKSCYGVVRGLHFQRPPFAQAKLIRALQGTIYDVAVDIRNESPTYGQWFGIELSAENRLQLFIPEGFAHGFSVLSEKAEILYKCNRLYSPQSEGGVNYADPQLGIDWKIDPSRALVSDKDRVQPLMADLPRIF